VIDVLGTLAPRAGVARGTTLLPPDDSPLWLAGVDVGVGVARIAAGAIPGFHVVGACGWTRQDALLRAAGEAVERFALLPAPDDPLVIRRGAVEAELRRCLVDACLIAEDGADVHELVALSEPPVEPIASTRDPRAGAREHLVPVGLVTDPAPDPDSVDASPSGAAAGPSWAFAARRALLECMERDAVLNCWQLRPALGFQDAVELAARTEALPAQSLAEAADYLARHQAEASTVFLPTDLPSVHTALTLITPWRGGEPLLAAGSRASHALADCAGTSLREAIQVHSALVNFRLDATKETPEAIRDESSRARYCLRAEASAHAFAWTRTRTTSLPQVAPEPSLQAILHGLQRLGLRPMFGDLTARLPRAVQDQGWRAVRAVVLGHQPFQMDDTKTWTSHLGRRAAWRQRLDGIQQEPSVLPHPLL